MKKWIIGLPLFFVSSLIPQVFVEFVANRSEAKIWIKFYRLQIRDNLFVPISNTAQIEPGNRAQFEMKLLYDEMLGKIMPHIYRRDNRTGASLTLSDIDSDTDTDDDFDLMISQAAQQKGGVLRHPSPCLGGPMSKVVADNGLIFDWLALVWTGTQVMFIFTNITTLGPGVHCIMPQETNIREVIREDETVSYEHVTAGSPRYQAQLFDDPEPLGSYTISLNIDIGMPQNCLMFEESSSSDSVSS